MAIQVGEVIGDYEVTGVLGRGGMGRVFRVRNRLTEREEAMKVVLADLEEDPDLADRFLREIKLHASLLHPNIAALHSAMRVEGRLLMFLELVEGFSLEELLRHGAVEIGAAIHYSHQVLAALACAHDRGVIHRDIKPSNILIAANGLVKLTDFGIARSTSAAPITGTGLAVGTLAYMSPEQIQAGAIDARSDIYSFGLTLYEMVAGRRPFQGETPHALMTAQLEAIPPAPSSLNPRIPEAVSAAIMRAIAKDPGLRFQSALEFQAALQQEGAGPVGSPPLPAPPRASLIPPVELAELETRLARALGPIARHLVTGAARRYGTISEIRQALAAQIADARQREEFLKSSPAVRPGTPTATMHASDVSFDPATLDRLAQALTLYLGPIAKVVVNRSARTARSLPDLQNALAGQIPSENDRRRFLAAVRSSA